LASENVAAFLLSLRQGVLDRHTHLAREQLDAAGAACARSTAGAPFIILVDGKVDLLGLSISTHITLDEKGFEFEIKGPIFGLFQATIKATGGRLNSSVGFALSVRMDNDLLTYLSEKATQAIKASADEANRQLTAAQNALTAEQAKVTALDAVVFAAREKVRARNQANLDNALATVAKWSAEVKRLGDVVAQQRAAAALAQQQAQAGLRKVLSDLDVAQRSVDDFQRQINDQKNWIHALEAQIAEKMQWVDSGNVFEKIGRGIEFAGFSAGKGAEITVANTKIGGLESARGLAWVGLESAKAILKGAQEAASNRLDDLNLAIQGPLGAQRTAQFSLDQARSVLQGLQRLTTNELIDLDPEVSGPLTQRSVAWAALEGSKQFLELNKKTYGGMADVSAFIVTNGLTGLIDVRSASFECSLVSGHSGSVDLDIDVGFMKQPPKRLQLSFNFHDPTAGATALAEQLRSR
jgi:hypothetical protein